MFGGGNRGLRVARHDLQDGEHLQILRNGAACQLNQPIGPVQSDPQILVGRLVEHKQGTARVEQSIDQILFRTDIAPRSIVDQRELINRSSRNVAPTVVVASDFEGQHGSVITDGQIAL